MVQDLIPSLQDAICCHCGRPVTAGQARWAGDPQERPWHYGCAEEAGVASKAVERYWIVRTTKEP
jgi:hypothetical protein